LAVLDTPYADINRLLESLLSHVRHIFQESLVGLYLYGSLTTGDFDPDSSDIDLLVVTSSEITAPEFEALRAMHRDLERDNPEWEDRVDVVYVPATALRTFRSEKSPIVISPGEPFHVREGEALRDWLQNWYIVRESGLTLFGPPPKSIIPPITQDEFVEAVRRYAAEVSERVRHDLDRKSQAYVILTMCRRLHVHRTGKQASKRQAALWAQNEFLEWSRLIQDALVWRQAWREEHVNHAATHTETIRFVSFVSDQVLA
jgi:predicted nucleotidyltransferase